MSGLSSSQAGPSTPIRAIPSLLASKAAPSIPPAAQTYEPLVKAVLRHRLLFRIFLYSLIFSWSLFGLISIWTKGGISALGPLSALVVPFLPSTITLTLVAWTLGVMPIIIVRKAYLSATPTSASSPSAVFRAAVKKNGTARSLLVYASSASLLSCVYVLMAYAYEATPEYDPRLTLFVKSKKHPYYLNGRLLYIIFSQLFLAALYLTRNIMTDRFAVKWKRHQANPEMRNFVLAQIITTFVTTVLLAALSVVGHTVLFGLVRSCVLLVLYRLPFLPRFLRPFSAHFLRGPWSIFLINRNAPLIYRAFTLTLVTIWNWEFSESIFDSSVAEPVHLAATTADPAFTLVSGITSADYYYKYFAYAELQQLASDDSATGSTRRTSLFTDQKYNPNMWSTLARETLRVLGQDYQLLLRRGASPAPAPAPAAPPKKPGVPPQIPATPLIRTQVLRPSRPSPLHSALNSIAADGAISSVISSTAELGASQIPELFRSVISSQPAVMAKVEPVVDVVKKSGAEAQKATYAPPGAWKAKLREELKTRAPQWVLQIGTRLRSWWTRERIDRAVEAALPNRKLDAIAIDTLCSLICASLTEDQYGVVQRDIPRILEALLSFLTAIEDYQSEIHTRYPEPSPDALQGLSHKELLEKEQLVVDVSRAGDVFSEVSDPLKEGLVRIVRTFGDKLAAFKFPARTARKLQGFVDFN